MDQLIVEVRRAFLVQALDILAKVWTTTPQAIIMKAMLVKGDKAFKLPHLKKEKAARSDAPISRELPVSPEAWVVAQEASQEVLAATDGRASD